MMLELERRVRTLEKENQRLRDTAAEPSGKLEETDREAVKAREEATALQAENERLQAERDALAAQAADIPALTAQLAQLEAGLQAAQVALRDQEATNATLRDEIGAANKRADRSEAVAAQTSALCKELQETAALAQRPPKQSDQQTREPASTIAELRERNQQLTAHVAALSAQLEAAAERRRQLDQYLPNAEQALQRASDDLAAMKEQRDVLANDLTQAQLAEQTARDQVNRLQSQHVALRTEYSKAMGVLDSRAGRIAKWWAARKAQDAPPQVDDI